VTGLLTGLAMALAIVPLAGCDDSPAAGRTDPAATVATGSVPVSPATPGAPTTTAASTGPTATAPGVAPRFARYVALGDSYTAAPGVPGRQSQDGCLRSDGNYPHLLAAMLGVRRLVDVSCSGAATADVRRPQLPGLAPQLDAVTRDTDLVTIGLGGNDLDLFGRLISGCLRRDASGAVGSPCTDTLGPTIPSALAQIERHVVDVVTKVRAAAPGARVVLVGYPQIVPASGGCEQMPFAPGDRAFVRQVNRGLAEAVRRAAATARTTYVDLWAASAHHDMCAADPWINGLTGQGAAPFHPFATEQAAVARLIEAKLR
jgi:lysophospholipase L1-like esterase